MKHSFKNALIKLTNLMFTILINSIIKQQGRCERWGIGKMLHLDKDKKMPTRLLK